MRLFTLFLIGLAIYLAPPLPSHAQNRSLGGDDSFRHEIQRSIDKGLLWLEKNQDPKGFWASADHPAVTALSLSAFMGEPTGRWKKSEPEAVRKGYAFLLDSVKPDGSIHRGQLVNYNTAISMMALLAANKKEHEPVLRKARAFLVASQIDFGKKGVVDDVFDGGIGYGSKYQHSDMNNTLMALEALHYSRHLVKDAPAEPDLNWAAAIAFLKNCQQLPANTQAWVSADPKDRGGFVYYPGHSMAGGVTNSATGKVALRSYASVSYAGMLSFTYADMKKDDPRLTAVFDWLQKNYTLTENPGMGPQGYYYYLHLMTKALTLYGVNELELKDGRRIHWRREVAMHLINLQKPDGSWLNDQHARWWEKETPLVTAYCLIALELIHRGL
jgi:squalene-hopene/tetraprenyl-beta-curcumene cyclase